MVSPLPSVTLAVHLCQRSVLQSKEWKRESATPEMLGRGDMQPPKCWGEADNSYNLIDSRHSNYQQIILILRKNISTNCTDSWTKIQAYSESEPSCGHRSCAL